MRGTGRSGLAQALVAGLVVGVSAITVQANEGVFLTGYDTLQMQRANAGVASPRNASWMVLNPAGLVDVEPRLDLNFYGVFTNAKLDPEGLIGNPFFGELQGTDSILIPSMGMVYDLPVGKLGLGTYVLSGSKVDYGRSRNVVAALFLGNADRRLEYQHFRAPIAYAYEFDNGWAVGASLHPSYSRLRTDHLTLQILPPENEFEWDTAWGMGFGLGVYKSWDRWSVGLGYISRNWVQHFEKYEDFLEHPVDLPHIIQAGVSYKVRPDLEVSLDYKFLDWADINNYGTDVRKSSFDWDSQHGVKLGVEWVHNEQFTFRAGYSYTNTPISEDHVFVSGLVPVNTEQHTTIDFTYSPNPGHESSLTYLHAWEKELEDRGTGDIFSRFARGTTLRTQADGISLQYSYKFGAASTHPDADTAI